MIVGNAAKRNPHKIEPKPLDVYLRRLSDVHDLNANQTDDADAVAARQEAVSLNANRSLVTLVDEFVRSLMELEEIEIERVNGLVGQNAQGV